MRVWAWMSAIAMFAGVTQAKVHVLSQEITTNNFLSEVAESTSSGPVVAISPESPTSNGISPEQQDLSKSEIDYGRLAIVGGALLGSMVVIQLYQQNGWWKDNRTSFHFQEDLVYSLSIDKFGHFFGGSALTFVSSRSLMWANVPERSALWWGAGMSLLFQSYVEVQDGFSTWGFDRVDFLADVGGAAWPVVQYYSPFLQNFDLKMSYHPSSLLNAPGGVGFRGQQHLMMDDYEGQTFWLSTKVNGLLPEPTASWWPDFLCLAVGTGVRDITTQQYRVYYVGLDLDMTEIIPQSSSFLKTLSHALNYIHFPLPAVRIYPNVAWYGIYF